MVAYEKFHENQMDDYIPTDEELAVYRAKLPKVEG
jgi:tryptophan synthase beta chain